jgi:hypothetical protein
MQLTRLRLQLVYLFFILKEFISTMELLNQTVWSMPTNLNQLRSLNSVSVCKLSPLVFCGNRWKIFVFMEYASFGRHVLSFSELLPFNLNEFSVGVSLFVGEWESDIAGDFLLTDLPVYP